MPKRPTLQDVAAAAGVAPATASYALRGERGSARTRQKVQEVADALGYAADPSARALASGTSGLVTIVCGSTRDPWQRALAADLARALMATGRRALVADADGDADREQELVAQMRDQRPDGMLVAPLDPFTDRWRDLAEQVPVVSIGDQLSDAPAAGAVVFDNDTGIGDVLAHLAGLGHRRVAVVLPQRPSTPDRPAEASIARHAASHHLEVSLVRHSPLTSHHQQVATEVAGALQSDPGTTAVFCLSDSLAFGTLRAADALGLSVPGDLSVVGFENVDLADLVGPGLTTVDWDQPTMVRAAVDQLIAIVEDGADPVRRSIPGRLVVRGSTAPPSRP